MNDQIHLFTLQLREQLAGLRQVAVQGRWEGPAPASLPRAIIATRLLAGSSELLGLAPLHGWLRVLLDLLAWIAANPDNSLGCYESVLREVVAFEEQLIDHLDAGGDPTEVVTAERIAALQQRFTAAARELADARSRGPGVTAGTSSGAAHETVALRLEGLADLRAAVSWERFLEVVERLVTKIPRTRPGEEPDEARAGRQARWREVRALCDALFETEDDGGTAPGEVEVAPDPWEALPDLKGGAVFREALVDGWREGTAAPEQDEDADRRAPWTLRWRVPGMTAEGPPPGTADVDEQFPAEEQGRYGRLLGLIAADLCATTGSGAPPWLLLVELGIERVTIEFRRPPGRLPAEAARSLGHLLEEDFLIEAPNLRGALRLLRREGALLHASFGPRGEGRLQVVLPLMLTEQPEVCVLPLSGGEVAAPMHLVEAVVPADGWQRRTEHDGEVFLKEDTRLLAADLANWVDGLLPMETEEGTAHLALVGLVEKRVALLAAGPARRARAIRNVEAPAGWAVVAASGVELADGVRLPLLDIERVIALRLCHTDAADGMGGGAGGEWTEVQSVAEGEAAEPPVSPADAPSPAGRILLLVASRFRAVDLEERLAKAGYAVTACVDPEVARERLGGGAFDAVICDNAEPARSLEALLTLLAERGENRPGPVILAAGSSGDGARRLARSLGADGVWTPPYLVDELRAQLIHAP